MNSEINALKKKGKSRNSRKQYHTIFARTTDLLARMDDPVSMYEDALEVIGKTVNADRAYIYALNDVDKIFQKYLNGNHRLLLKSGFTGRNILL